MALTDRHCFDINQLQEDHNSLREDYQELEAEAAALRIRLSQCRIDCAIVPIVAFPPSLPLVLLISQKFHTPSIEVWSLGTVSLAPTTPEPIPVPPPVASLLPLSDSENIPPLCLSGIL